MCFWWNEILIMELQGHRVTYSDCPTDGWCGETSQWIRQISCLNVYITENRQRAWGRKRKGRISEENNKARLAKMKRMPRVWESERMTEKMLVSAFCNSHHILTWLSLLQEQWRLLRLKLLKVKSEIKEHLSSQRKLSRASCLRIKWPQGGTGMGEQEERRQAWQRKGLSWWMTCCMLSKHVHNRLNDKEKQFNVKVHPWQVTLRWERLHKHPTKIHVYLKIWVV